jgi:hypothetical protein
VARAPNMSIVDANNRFFFFFLISLLLELNITPLFFFFSYLSPPRTQHYPLYGLDKPLQFIFPSQLILVPLIIIFLILNNLQNYNSFINFT